ncbi:MAG: cysteine synthase family protein [Chitinophagales bacterium]|nr:cysteine synthase family protein [Chitinophagales bacterium]
MIQTITHTAIEKIDQIRHLIGDTPIHNFGSADASVKLSAKLEWYQIGGSVKSRAAYFIIKNAIEKGFINEEIRLLDASSGNTAIAYAAICEKIGLQPTICLPENASAERKSILEKLGAEIVYTSPFEGTDGAQAVAKHMAETEPSKYYYADQYNNEYNWKAHYLTTAGEIWRQTDGKITHFVAGLGTTGTVTGTALRLKEMNPNIQIIALQPDIAMHGLEGWKHLETAIIPGIYDSNVIDQKLAVSTTKAYKTIVKLAEDEGLLVSPSSAANYIGAAEVASSLSSGHVVTMFPDDASKYKEVLNEIL